MIMPMEEKIMYVIDRIITMQNLKLTLKNETNLKELVYIYKRNFPVLS